jgi:hypothetical protein
MVTQTRNESDSNRHESSDGEDFLLADFQFMASYTQESLRIADKRVDVLLALSTAVFGGLIALSAATSTDRIALLYLALFTSFGLTIVGGFTFRDLLVNNMLMCEYARELNLIRKYFAERYSHIQPFVMMPTDPHHPKYNWRSSGEAIIETINSLSGGIFFATCSVLFQHFIFDRSPTEPTSMLVAAIVFAALAAGAFFLQYRKARKMFGDADASASEERANGEFYASHQRLSFTSGKKKLPKGSSKEEVDRPIS